MKTYLAYKDEKSAKFWQIEISGDSHTVTYGKIGTDGQSKTKEFNSFEKEKGLWGNTKRRGILSTRWL